MQRVHPSVGLDRSARRDQRLTGDLTTEHALHVDVGAGAAEDVDLDRFELEHLDQRVDRVLLHGGHPGTRPGGPTHLGPPVARR